MTSWSKEEIAIALRRRTDLDAGDALVNLLLDPSSEMRCRPVSARELHGIWAARRAHGRGTVLGIDHWVASLRDQGDERVNVAFVEGTGRVGAALLTSEGEVRSALVGEKHSVLPIPTKLGR